ncbi:MULTISPECIES: ABC transporter ATP-binding protein [unclassified Aureimonas]|uniref:ABC transporter ATP-binding protein n=1 Tax=unclassified Aureimonas TaxID=2615206 RepID=UPI0006FF137E|nr:MULTISPECIES: ABC transporter ATP-binding protein [unclassified Aureimonas]KQT69614.1 multidrug ABC transporter ATP-binding protein [Aureimonas sp. Leaf427]KQT80965.1 multidrug ABC transporter ATP-binding protein [Aureimonas sp. Leaf460]
MTSETSKRSDAIRAVLSFTVRNWAAEKPLVALLVVSIVAATLADIFVPLFAGRLIDAVAASGVDRDTAFGEAWPAVAAMASLGLAYVLLRHVAWAAVVPLTLRIMSGVSARAFARLQHFSTDWHANAFSGSIVRQITRGMWSMDTLHDTLLLALLPSAVVLVGTVGLLAWHWPVMGLVMAVGAVSYTVLTVLLSTRYIAPASRISNQLDTRVGGVLADALACNAVVKAFGAEGREEARLQAAIGDWRGKTRITWMRHTWSGTLQAGVLWAVRLAVTGAALLLWWNGSASPGDVTYVLTTYFVVHGYLRDIGMHVNNLQRAVNEAEELVALLAIEPQVADRPGAGALAVPAGEILFERVDFHYGRHARPLYEGFDVTIAAGTRVGLVGHSGSGKTTFVKLVQRLYDVNGGAIRIDGTDIASVAQGSLRSRIAIVPQEPILFHRSLAENIAYGRPCASRGEIEAAARLASAHDFISGLHEGYETMVGERGVKLSGGERQRVALARAFLADAPILVLDEATSSLDSESEAMIQAASERLMEGRTALVIAHRLSTVARLDRILVFERGRIVEDGPPDMLMRRPSGHFRRLAERQAGGMLAAE